MSFVTRCTSCGTLFKVVADQLKISEGWVRCGQCATVFDAQANLVDAPQVAPAPAPAPAPTPTPTPTHKPTATPATSSTAPDATNSRAFSTDSTRDSSFNPQDREALLAAFSSSSSFAALGVDAATVPASLNPPAPTQSASSSGFSSGSTVPASSPQPAQMGALKTRPSTSSSNSRLDSQPESRLDSQSFRPGALRNSGEMDSEAGPSTSSWASSEYPQRAAQAAAISFSEEPTTLHSPSSIDASSLPEPDLASPSTTPQPTHTPSFVKQAQRAQRWRSPWMRLGLSLICLILMATLAAQIALYDKDRIAAHWPQTKPWLDQLCQRAGCQVQAFKQIEAIAVDSSSFNRINKNNAQLEAITQSYRLSVALKNTGTLPVALPHVELSMQDAQDVTILRRVLSPADLGANLQALAPLQDMAGSLTLQIETAQLSGQRIAGYRVLAFYP